MMRAFVFGVPAPFATTNAARAAAWRRIVAVATAFGWPHDPTESDYVRVGGGIHVPLADLPRWVYWSRPRVITGGPLTGSVVVFLDPARPAIAALDGLVLPVPATYDGVAVPGGAGNVTISLGAGVPVTSDHLAGDEE